MQHFLPVAALPQWELSMKVAQLFGLRGPWRCQVCRDMDCLHHWSHGSIRVFYQDSCSWRSEGLFGQSFSVAPPVQALRGLPCLGPFSVAQGIRHIEGPPWLGSYSVDRCVRGQVFDGPACLLFSCWCWSVGRQKLWWWFHPLCVTQQYCLASMAARLSSTGISYHSLLLHRSSIRLSAVNSSPCSGIAP